MLKKCYLEYTVLSVGLGGLLCVQKYCVSCGSGIDSITSMSHTVNIHRIQCFVVLCLSIFSFLLYIFVFVVRECNSGLRAA